MFINPKKAIDNGWLQYVPSKCIQPNAVDIPMTRMWEVQDDVFVLNVDGKTHRSRVELTPTMVDDNVGRSSLWEIGTGSYDFMSNVYVKVPEGHVGWLHTRSTLNRNGLFVHSGIYDSGFEGPVCGMLYNHIGTAHLEVDACVAQFIIAESDSQGIYTGDYNMKDGEVWHER
jgi:dUTP pyrophosphatase